MGHDRPVGQGADQGPVRRRAGLALPCPVDPRSGRVGVARHVETAAAVADPDLACAGPGVRPARRPSGLLSSMGWVGGWALPATASVRAPRQKAARGRRAIASSRWGQPQPSLVAPSSEISCSGSAVARSASTSTCPLVRVPGHPRPTRASGQPEFGPPRNADRGGEVFGPFQGQAREPECLHKRPG